MWLATAPARMSRPRRDTQCASPAGTHPPYLVDGLRRHLPALQAQARRLCRNAQDASDLVQDTQERALRTAAARDPHVNLLGWLLTVQRNLWTDWLRRQRAAQHVNLESAEHVPSPVPEAESPSDDISETELQEAVQRLEAPFLSVVTLHYLYGMRYEQIAARLSIPKATVGTRLHRARKQLSELLGRS
jgi:RNA polymerase sigma-70 factor, ECF subfamily